MTPGRLQTKPPASALLHRIRIFVGSPGDVVEEREILDGVVKRLNQQFSKKLGLLLELVNWTQVPPSMGRPQGVIFSHLPPESWDVFIGIIWRRFGSPTGGMSPSTGHVYESGTEEEFDYAYRLFKATGKPLIRVYRCNRPHVAADPLDQTQSPAIERFFRRFEHDGEHPGLYRTYESSQEFEQLLFGHLSDLALELSLGKSPADSDGHSQADDYTAHARASLKPILARWRSVLETKNDWGIDLHLRKLEGDDAADRATAYSGELLGQCLSEGRSVLLLGPPGAGKTNTLLRLAANLLAHESAPVPLLASVSAWVLSETALDAYVVDQLVRLGIPPEGAEQLLASGRVAVLLDGWNEAPEAENANANIRLNAFVLGRPSVPLALTTRKSNRAPWLPGSTTIEVSPLSRDQKVAIITGALDDPRAFMASVDSNQALSAVTDTPLFLSAALEIARMGRPIPTTRSGLLGAFIWELEHVQHHPDRLNDSPCHGLHHAYLEAIARGMTARGETTIARASLQTLIAEESRRLLQGGELHSPGAPLAILESLVRRHCLVLQPGVEDIYSFIHQQFQEWFASRWLGREVKSSGMYASADEQFSFQRDVLNRGHWQEALTFAAEAFAVDNDHSSLARLLHWMMPVDLIAAAGIARIGGLQTWRLVGPQLGAALRTWHAQAGVHARCALAAMLATGSQDFSELILPALETSEQDMASIFGMSPAFALVCLGEGWRLRFATWSQGLQIQFLHQLGQHGEQEALDFLEDQATSGLVFVREAALEGMLSHRAFQRIVAVLGRHAASTWPPDLYERVLRRLPREAVGLLANQIALGIAETSAPLVRLGLVRALRHARDDRWLSAARSELDDTLSKLRESATDSTATTANVIAPYVSMLIEVEGDRAVEKLIVALQPDLIWESALTRSVEAFPESLRVALAPTVVARTRHFQASRRVKALTALPSAKVVGALVRVYLSARALSEDIRRGLEAAFRELPLERVVDGMVEQTSEAATPEDLLAVAELLPTPSRDVTAASSLTSSQRDSLQSLLHRIGQIAFAEQETTRSILPKLALLLAALGNEEDVTLVAQWFSTEQSLLNTYLEDRRTAQREGTRPGVLRCMSNHPNWYCPALAMFRCDAAEQVLTDLLRAPSLAENAAAALEDLCVLEGILPAVPSSLDSPSQRWRRPALAFTPGPRVHARANAIASALDELDMVSSDDPNLGEYSYRAAGVLARLGDERGIDRLLRQTQRRLARLSLLPLRAAIVRGAVLPGHKLADALEGVLSEGEVENHSGGYDSSWDNTLQVFALILASDAPAIAIERMRRLPRHRLQSYARRDLVDLLAGSKQSVAAAFLVELSEEEETPDFEDVVYALGQSDDAACHLRIVNMIAANATDRTEPVWDALKWALGQIGKQNEGLAQSLVSALRAAQVHVGRRLAQVLAQVRSVSVLALLLEQDDLLSLEGAIGELLDDLSEDHIPLDYANAYEVVPRDATEPRRVVAKLLHDGGTRRQVAARLLARLAAKQLERGRPSNEHLHPDIEQLRVTSVPWALLN